MGLRLFFLPDFSRATFIQGATFIPDSRVASNFAFSVWDKSQDPTANNQKLRIWITNIHILHVNTSTSIYFHIWLFISFMSLRRLLGII